MADFPRVLVSPNVEGMCAVHRSAFGGDGRPPCHSLCYTQAANLFLGGICVTSTVGLKRYYFCPLSSVSLSEITFVCKSLGLVREFLDDGRLLA